MRGGYGGKAGIIMMRLSEIICNKEASRRAKEISEDYIFRASSLFFMQAYILSFC